MVAVDSSSGSPFRLTDPRQIRIHERLERLAGPGPAAFFYDACRLTEESPLYKSTTHLVAHLLREVESALRDVLEPVRRSSKVSAAVVRRPKENHKEEIRDILNALHISTDDPIGQMWLQTAVQSNEGTLNRRAHRRSLGRPRPFDEDFQQFWSNMQDVLDVVSSRLELKFSEYRPLMDELIAKDVPVQADIETLCTNIPNSTVTWSYLFTRLQSPHWIRPLREAGVFGQIPDGIQHDNGVSFPVWPAAKYLKHVALAAPDEVGRVLLDAPETDNQLVISDLTELACVVPVAISVSWADRMRDWAGRQEFLSFGLPGALGNLINHLCRAGQVVAGQALAESLFDVREDPRAAHDDHPDSLFHNILEPTARFDLWEYERVLVNILPGLLEASPEGGLALLGNLLERAIVLSDRRGAERQPEDGSQIWYRAIEDHSQNLDRGLKYVLAKAVREGAEEIARKDPDSVSRLVQGLERRGQSWNVFQRIALHLLRVFTGSAHDLVRERLLDRRLFNSAAIHHEYFLLQQQCFGTLPTMDQSTILAWIHEGPPNREKRKRLWEEQTGVKITPDEEEQYVRRWKRDRLTPMAQYLNAAHKATYDSLVSDTGTREHPEFLSFTKAGFVGVQSPISHQELGALSHGEIVDYLNAWKPSGDPIKGASVQGLAAEITRLVSGNPERYAEAVVEFKGLSEPTYVRGVIEGFWHALNGDKSFPWQPVLDLSEWAVTRDSQFPCRRSAPFEMDSDWGPTRASAARLLNKAFYSETNPLPHALRESAWRAIEPVTHDTDPTPQREKTCLDPDEGEQQFGGVNLRTPEPFEVAINSVRGVALEATIEYALWVRRGFEVSANRDELLSAGFNAMPEVRRVLKDHLDPNIESSLVVRSVYGAHLLHIHALDSGWTEQNVTRLFPRDRLEWWETVWNTYICRWDPYGEAFEWLEAEYAFAVERIGSHKHKWGNPEAPDFALAQHLIAFYWQGKMNYPGGMLDEFYRRAGGRLRGQVVSFVGLSLYHTKESLDEKIAERLKTFWARRIEAAEAQPDTASEELYPFGWWIASRKFDDEWALQQLLRTLRLVGWVKPDHLVVERLAEMSQTRPLACIQALRAMIEWDKTGWGIVAWRDKAKTIIRIARGSGDPRARAEAEELINLLDSRGNFDFGELLKESIN